MKRTGCGRLFHLVCIVMVSVVVVSCASSRVSSEDRDDSFDAIDSTKKTQQEVQSELMAFADRFFAASLDAARTLERTLETPEGRYNAVAAKLVALTVTTDIAASPNPGSALLDMVVFVTLKRIVWEDYWMPEVYGEAGQPVLETMYEMEEDIWNVAAGVYTPQQLDALRSLIDDWRKEHPHTSDVDFVRLTELGDARQAQTLIEAGRPGGMLAPVKEASRTIEEMRLLTERLAFMAIRMQMMISFQVEMATTRLAMQPEVRQLLEDSLSFTEASNRFAEAFATLATDLPEERQAAIDQFLSGLGEERKRLLADLADEDGNLNITLGNVRDTVEQARQLAEMLNQTVVNTDALVARVLADEPARKFDILDYKATIEEATITLREFQAVLTTIDRLLASAAEDNQLDPIIEGANRLEDEVIDEIIDRAFLRGVALIVIFFIVLSLYRLSMRRWAGAERQRQDTT